MPGSGEISLIKYVASRAAHCEILPRYGLRPAWGFLFNVNVARLLGELSFRNRRLRYKKGINYRGGYGARGRGVGSGVHS
jgi:hypothetical protein